MPQDLNLENNAFVRSTEQHFAGISNILLTSNRRTAWPETGRHPFRAFLQFFDHLRGQKLNNLGGDTIMRNFGLVIGGVLALLSLSAQAGGTAVPLGNSAACMQGPLAEFGQYIGNWNTHDSQLSKDGTEWTEGAGARWNFVCIGDGTAIQDFWMPNDGPVGTNLRTYNSETES
jgi:hypothetical protein